jgi:hypothetical protein
MDGSSHEEVASLALKKMWITRRPPKMTVVRHDELLLVQGD